MIETIAPQKKERLIDLASAAGVDVSDWAKSTSGRAASNPKYCYEWCFVQPGKVVVLNVWHQKMDGKPQNGITVDLDMRDFATRRPEPERTRAIKMDEAIQIAIRDSLPIRIITLSGRRRGEPGVTGDAPSKVSKRSLDPISWGVANYDHHTGKCTLQRGLETHLPGDVHAEFPDVDGDAASGMEGRKRWAEHFRRERNPKLVRAKKAKVLAETGRLACEVCTFDFAAFYDPHGQGVCECHHRKPLASLDRPTKTRLEDLAIMCSNCHRVIHLIKPMPTVEQFRAMMRK